MTVLIDEEQKKLKVEICSFLAEEGEAEFQFELGNVYAGNNRGQHTSFPQCFILLGIISSNRFFTTAGKGMVFTSLVLCDFRINCVLC